MMFRQKLLSFLTSFLLFIPALVFSQNHVVLSPYQAWNMADLYSADSVQHTAWKPILYIDTLSQHGTGAWLKRKIYDEHLIMLEQPGLNIYGDFIPDAYLGVSKRFVKNPNMNTRGYRFTGNAGTKLYFETEFYENQGQFAGYIDSFIRRNSVIPGQNNYKNIGDGKGFDFNYSSARLVYVPNKHFLFDLGYGKNFIGDGYRSLLLSDWSYNYPYLRISTEWKKFQYSVMWNQYISSINGRQGNTTGFYRKWSQTYLLDWKPIPKLSIGLFETVIWPGQDSMGRKDISWTLASPIIFLHDSKTPAGVANNTITGLNLKYKLLSKTYLYAQFAIDQLAKSDSWKSRYATQLGVRTADLFKVPHLNVMAEFNMARPYMYAGNSTGSNYEHFNQALADPLGANFKEGILVADYSYKRWWFRLETFYAKYGDDSTTAANYGHDISKPLATHSVETGVKTGQGISSKLSFADIKVAYVINKHTNLRIEMGVTVRKDTNRLRTYNDQVFTIGLRSSFRNFFYDF